MYSLYDSRNKFTNNLKHLQQFDANDTIVHPYNLLIIVHDCYILRKPYIAILDLSIFFKILVRAVHSLYDSRNKSSSNLEHLQQLYANGIIAHPYKLLNIVHDCYKLRKSYIAILALL